jgi:hypothetical protein
VPRRTVRGASARHSGSFVFFFFFFAPRARLWTGNDTRYIGILVTCPCVTGRVGPADFGFFASADLFLLAFLPRSLARALLLCDLGPARHIVLPEREYVNARTRTR